MWKTCSIFCPHCRQYTALTPAPVHAPNRMVEATWDKNPDETWWMGVCNSCDFPVLVLNDGTTVFPTQLPEPTDERVPEAIRNDLDEAKACMQVHAYRAAAVMARRVIQQVAIDKGCTKGNLVNQIDELALKGVITTEVKEWATVVRFVGNDAAHPTKIAVRRT